MKSRILVLAIAAAAALVAAGCNKPATITDAKTEGIWIDAGRLNYHIQASRILEPGVTPDSTYLKGVPLGVSPSGQEVWFAVFLRVENKSDKASLSAKQFEITDTQGNTFSPIAVNTNLNPFAYKPTVLAPNKAIPLPDSPQDFDSVSGAMLLFKIPLVNYQNRPLTFHVHSADGTAPPEARLDLDV